jgi:hypothetical protein
MSIRDAENIAQVPASWRVFSDVKVWFEEAIFGHRIWHRQTPWLLLLEFLNVAEAQAREGRELFKAADPTELQPYRLRYRMGLRNILFASDALADIARQPYDDVTLWDKWLKSMEGAEAAPSEGFGFLRERIKSFKDFAALVTLVRQTTLEDSENLRWSSRFIFPFGVNALYSDANVSKGKLSRDYNNFGRTGEILYYMISRSRFAAPLAERFKRLLDPEHPKNRLIGLLCAETDDRTGSELDGNSFLPYRSHPAFDRLAEDWLAVLDLKLPAQDAYAHLAPLGALHVLLYHLETAAVWADRPARPSLICEMIAPKRGLVRQRSIGSYNDNDALARQALNTVSEAFFSSPSWPVSTTDPALEEERLEAAREILRQEYSFKGQEVRAADAEGLRMGFEEALEAKLDANCGLVHSAYGRHIGLVSRRGTTRNRYAPTDELLKTLVIARVKRRAELSHFLADLYEHYGLVFGPEEARLTLSAEMFDNAAFVRNRERLEARLASMGLLKRLSDGCAYVNNPFAKNEPA